MFIAQVALKSALAPQERKVRSRNRNIALLRSDKVLWGTGFYRHFVPPELQTHQRGSRICSANFRDRTLAFSASLIGFLRYALERLAVFLHILELTLR